jgi:predicted porin
MSTNRFNTGLVFVLACILLSFSAAVSAQDSNGRQQQLEQRVVQLEQQLAELKSMVQAQKAAPPAAAQNAVVAPKPVSGGGSGTLLGSNISTAPALTIALHGFIDTSFFLQSQDFTFGNGQNAEFPVPNTGSNHTLSGLDVRNTRAWIDIEGAPLSNGWGIGGHLEGDFFGGFNGTGGYSAQQETPRLRQAFIKLSNADNGSTVTIGQQWDLLFPGASVPESLTHIAFPLGYASGMIGWRFPGVVWSQNLSQTKDAMALGLDLGAFSGSWNGPGSNTNFDTAANAKFSPQIEARLRAQSGDWLGYLVGHYSTEDLSGVGGGAPTPITGKITSWAVELGTTWHPGPWSLRAAAYDGKGLGQVFGALAQFGDIKEFGGYVQGGYKFTSNWALYAEYATGRPDKGDVITWMSHGSNGLLKSQQYALDLIYADGPYGLGVEWMHAVLDSTTDGITTSSTGGNQLSFSAIYRF